MKSGYEPGSPSGRRLTPVSVTWSDWEYCYSPLDGSFQTRMNNIFRNKENLVIPKMTLEHGALHVRVVCIFFFRTARYTQKRNQRLKHKAWSRTWETIAQTSELFYRCLFQCLGDLTVHAEVVCYQGKFVRVVWMLSS